jgi:glycosyltransferase involved in cell wall biosynthesis
VTTRFAIILQTPRDQHSSVYLTYQALTAEIASRGHVATILTPQDFPWARRAGGRFTPLVHPLAVAQWVARHSSSVDLVVFHSYAGWLALGTGVARRLRVVVAFHGLEPIYHQELAAQQRDALSWRYRLLQERLMPKFLQVACGRADLVTCLNTAEAEFLVRRGWVDAGRIAVVAHGVPDPFFLPARPARPPRTLLFVAQWLPMKGIGPLSSAFATLARRHPEVRLVCAGTLAGEDEVRAAFPEDVRARVTVLPRVDQDRLAAVYRDADIFLFPSVYEGFGLAIVEAMAARLPIVTTRVGVVVDALQDGASAIVVPARPPAAIVEAVERLLADDGLRQRLGESAAASAASYRERDRVRQWADRLLSVEAR